MTYEVTLGSAAAVTRRRLGPVAWCALEVIAEQVQSPADGYRAEASVRTIAAQLGIADNTAHRALRRLVATGLVEPCQSRSGHGRFGAGTYRLTTAPDLLRISFELEQAAAAALPPKSLRPRQLTQVGEQLALLPSS